MKPSNGFIQLSHTKKKCVKYFSHWTLILCHICLDTKQLKIPFLSLSGAYVDLFNVVKSTKTTATIPESSSNMATLNSDAVFAAIKEKVNADPAKAKSVNGVFLYKITKDGKIAKEWSKFLKNQIYQIHVSPKVELCQLILEMQMSVPS